LFASNLKQKTTATPYKINCLVLAYLEIPSEFSIRFVFTKLVLKKCKKSYTNTLANIMKKTRLLFMFFFINTICFSQQLDTLQFKSYYKISFAGKPQKVELIKLINNSFKGNIITELYYSNRKSRSTKNRTWRSIKKFIYNKTEFLRKKEINKVIIDTAYINSNLAEKLFKKLEEKKIFDIKDCLKEKNCINFLDGDYTSFKLKKNALYKEFGFEELYPTKNGDYYETGPNNRIESQEILTIIYKELNLEDKFYSTIKRLPKGSYSYFSSGNSMIHINNSKKR